jgi:hypothetical protein
METLGLKELHPEGQFFSDTYAFPKGTSDVEYLRRANAMLNTVLQEEWANRSDNLPLESPYEALILASIVEKETAVASERPLIAGVFLSRLIKRMRPLSMVWATVTMAIFVGPILQPTHRITLTRVVDYRPRQFLWWVVKLYTPCCIQRQPNHFTLLRVVTGHISSLKHWSNIMWLYDNIS